jgi:hypothetical protein
MCWCRCLGRRGGDGGAAGCHCHRVSLCAFLEGGCWVNGNGKKRIDGWLRWRAILPCSLTIFQSINNIFLS